METKDSIIFFEEYYETLNKLQKEDKFIESIELASDLGSKFFNFLLIKNIINYQKNK